MPYDYCQREPTLYLLSPGVTFLLLISTANTHTQGPTQPPKGTDQVPGTGIRDWEQEEHEDPLPLFLNGSDFIMTACCHAPRDHKAAEVRGVPRTQLTSWSMHATYRSYNWKEA